MNTYIKNILRFIVIILFQVLILDRINLRWWNEPFSFPLFVPYAYPLFILLLPFETPVWGLIIIGFITGLTVDSFMNTAGMHAAAAVLIAYLRNNVLRALLPRHLSDYPNQEPSTKSMGWMPFLTYSFFLMLIHDFVYFVLELWNVSNIGFLMLKVLASAVTSMLLIIAYLLLFTRQSSSRI